MPLKRLQFRRIRLALESLEQRELPSSTLLTVDAPVADSSDYANDHILVRWLDELIFDRRCDGGINLSRQ